MKLHNLTAVFCFIIVGITILFTQAQAVNISVQTSNAAGYVFCEYPTCVQRDRHQFFISNETHENQALVYDDMSNKELIANSEGLKSVHLFRSRLIVGLKKNGDLYVLAPDKNGKEFHVDERSFIRKPFKVWHWVKIASRVTDVFVDQNDILIIQKGSWSPSSPSLHIFNLEEHETRYVQTQGTQIACGLNCLEAYMSSIYSMGIFDTQNRKPTFINLEIVNFERIEYDEFDRISIKFQDYPSALPLSLVKKYKDQFISKN